MMLLHAAANYFMLSQTKDTKKAENDTGGEEKHTFLKRSPPCNMLYSDAVSDIPSGSIYGIRIILSGPFF